MCAENEFHAYQAGKNVVNDAPAVQYMCGGGQTAPQQLSAVSWG
jgi:hypothetical protein